MFIAIPEGYYGRIVGRSGLANTHGITVHNGTTDSDYRGIVCVVLFNLFNEEYVAETGNRIGQLVIEWCYTPKFVEVNEFNEEKTVKGQRGDMKELHYKLLNILLLTCFNNGFFLLLLQQIPRLWTWLQPRAATLPSLLDSGPFSWLWIRIAPDPICFV